jgi:polyphosphate kinase
VTVKGGQQNEKQAEKQGDKMRRKQAKTRRRSNAPDAAPPGAKAEPTRGRARVARSLFDPRLYINRELSLLAFHRRVLAQSRDESAPLLERLRFLTICSTILDEFFEIRVGRLQQEFALELATPGPDGMTPQQVLGEVSRQAHELVAEQYRVLNEEVLPALATEGIRLLRRGEWGRRQREWIADYFDREVAPVLTPMGLDPSHPFPNIQNKLLNFIVTLEGRDAFGRDSGVAVVQVPRALPRIVELPRELSETPFAAVMLSSIIHAHIDALFPGMRVTGCHQFRVTRNSDLWVDEEEIDDLKRALEGELVRRPFGDAVRLEVADTCPADIRDFLRGQFDLGTDDVYAVDGPVNLHRLATLCGAVPRADLRYRPFIAGTPERMSHSTDLFETLRRGDVATHQPYQGFSPVLELLRQAADDPDVLAIKMTVYRTGQKSPAADLLMQAARNGKEVTAVVELRARFDEAANIDLASRLHEAGATVVYGVVGYKTHCKLLLIVRREGGRLRRYCHLGTGNYHAGTARLYTDVGYLSAREDLSEDVHNVFMQLTALGRARELHHVLHAPFHLHESLCDAIDREAEAAAAGKPARIVAKMNALTEERIIRRLYRASQAGVQVDLVVRGPCCLRPGVKGVSENIRVRSIVGRFLEHSRVYYFENGGDPQVFCASADWMGRNFFRRIETAWPVIDPELRERVTRECLTLPLEDNTTAWLLGEDGTYQRAAPPEGALPRNCQAELLNLLAVLD